MSAGTLYLVGTGPGDPELIVPRARAAIRASTDIVAYGFYLELLGDVCDGRVCHQFPIGEETGRARLALDLAAEGKVTSLVSSGDIGIYAMATLVFELIDRFQQGESGNPDWLNIEIEIVPGISAMQAAASRCGAILGHDFCTISLSNLLTSWETIENRLHAAGAGDFVVSFYNPRSKQRDWQIEVARDILLEYRPQHTPVILGRQITRPEEHVRILELGELKADDVDMFTLVSVGNRQSRRITTVNREWVYTPRGYRGKT